MQMTPEQQQAVLNMCQANVMHNLRTYQSLRKWFNEIGFDPTELDAIPDAADRFTPPAASEPEQPGGNGFRSAADGIPNPG